MQVSKSSSGVAPAADEHVPASPSTAQTLYNGMGHCAMKTNITQFPFLKSEL